VRGQPGADRGATERDDAQLVGGAAERAAAVVERLRPAAEHLAPRDRHGILKVRASGLDDVALARGVAAQRPDQRGQLGVERLEQLERHQADRRGRDVVG